MNAQFAGATFEEWVGSIESLPKENFGPKVIKQYIAEMYLSIGPTPLDRKEINARFDQWFLLPDSDAIDKDEFVGIIRDMFENEQFPIKDCPECKREGRACFDNDGGLSHSRSMGTNSQFIDNFLDRKITTGYVQ